MELEKQEQELTNRMSTLESRVSSLIAQKNRIENELNQINVEALKIQGKLELIQQLKNNNGETERDN